MKAFNAIIKTESKLVLRGMDTIFFGVLMPIVVAVILGFINGNKPAYEGANYSFMQQSFGALSSIGICATGLMGFPLVIADYRHKKILKRFQVTPVSPAIILLVQCVINLVISLISLLCVYTICALLFQYKMAGSLGMFLLAYGLVLIAIYGIGMMLSSVSPNIKTANLLCTLIYFPMILFSGATIPYEIMPTGAQKIMDFLPLTQGIKLLKAVSLNLPLNNVFFQVCLMAMFAVVCIIISIRFFKWE
ncbi:MAG TPA: ABC transporter permease [Pseudobacteroides sp.]|uniref:ABC transporter permease n=1 Tax=Pseudobacteroides sp. TaxID=1968840 RepID=UPI002F945BAD